jgi:prepilin-type N-terminal cleavage/methylation domain-containing protein
VYMKQRTRASGFTLIEVLVALVVSAIILLGARAILIAMSDNTQTILGDTRAVDESANADRSLRLVVRQLDVADGPGTEFAGDSTLAIFSSWCDAPRGSLDRCAVKLSIEADTSGRKLLLAGLPGGTIVIRSGLRSVSLRYLDSAALGGHWIETWAKGITAPLAIGIIAESDTLIVRVGERG